MLDVADKVYMDVLVYQKAIFSILLVPCLVAAISRLDVLDASSPDVYLSSNAHCVGVEHRQIGLQMVCSQPVTGIIDEAIVKFQLPTDCANIALPDDIVPGDVVRLAELRGRCRFVSKSRLGGVRRLLSGGKIDVNTDTVDDLVLLPGIGPARAKQIVEMRQNDGPFRTADELLRVRGIGEKTLERIRPWIDCGR